MRMMMRMRILRLFFDWVRVYIVIDWNDEADYMANGDVGMDVVEVEVVIQSVNDLWLIYG
jgi:hypothetical protein